MWKIFLRILSFLWAASRALHAWELLRDSIDELL
jgi:hypothetical protein